MIVVSGTTPLRHLIAIGEAELLPKLYGNVIVPGAVWAELQAEATPLIVKTWPVRSPPPIGRFPFTNFPPIFPPSFQPLPAFHPRYPVSPLLYPN
jgi:hypothetical protein